MPLEMPHTSSPNPLNQATAKMKSIGIAKSEWYTKSIAAAGLLLAERLLEYETSANRKEKMSAIIRRKATLFDETFKSDGKSVGQTAKLENVIRNSVGRNESITFLIDLAFINPFAPYEIKFTDDNVKKAMRSIAAALGRSDDVIDRVFATRKNAFKAHRKIAYGKIAALTVAGLVLAAVGGWAAAPYIGTAIGSAAGLSGAAATAHGLAILGGGSLAIGGFGMAGGTWLVVGSSVLLAGLSGGAALLAVGPAAAKIELVKLQITFREVFLADQKLSNEAQNVITSLLTHRDEISATLEEERSLNEKHAKRVKEIEETLQAINDAVAWMKKAQKEL